MTDLEDVDVEDMAEYLDDVGVEYAVLFGSHARGDAEPDSDIDVAVRFPDEYTPRERFRLRNRVDAALQAYAEEFVDVSDLDDLPASVALRALRDGRLLTGDEQLRDADRRRVEREYEATREEREAARRAFLDDLAEGRS